MGILSAVLLLLPAAAMKDRLGRCCSARKDADSVALDGCPLRDGWMDAKS